MRITCDGVGVASKDIDIDIDTEIDELRSKLNALMSSDYRAIYTEVLTLSIQLDNLLNLIQT